MKCPHNAHIALVDGERFLLLRNDGQMFEPQLTLVTEPKLEPSNYSAGVRHQDDIGQRKGNTDLEELAHGAAASEWLNARALENSIEQLVVIADPKTLGEMRRHYHQKLSERIVGEIDKALTGESLENVARAIENA